MLKFVDDKTGKEYEVGPISDLGKMNPGDLYLSHSGGVWEVSGPDRVRGIMLHSLTPIPEPPKRHTFGNVVFEEVEREEGGPIRFDEFYLDIEGDLVWAWEKGEEGELFEGERILRPVSIVTEEEPC